MITARILPYLGMAWYLVADGFGRLLWQLNEGKYECERTDCWQLDMFLVSLNELNVAKGSPHVHTVIISLAANYTHMHRFHP